MKIRVRPLGQRWPTNLCSFSLSLIYSICFYKIFTIPDSKGLDARGCDCSLDDFWRVSYLENNERAFKFNRFRFSRDFDESNYEELCGQIFILFHREYSITITRNDND